MMLNLPQGHNLNKLGSGPLYDAIYTKYQALGLVVSNKIFSCFPYISLCKTCDPQSGPIFGPRGIISTNLIEVHYMMLFRPQVHNLNKLDRGPLDDDTYQISRLKALWFQTGFFHVFPKYACVKHVTPG